MEKKRAVILQFEEDRSRHTRGGGNTRPGTVFRVEYPVRREWPARFAAGRSKGRRIDLEMTGKLLRLRLRRCGLSVKDLQKELGLECPQSIYRWFKGQALPSVENLYVMHRILDCSMEDLLVTQENPLKLRCASYLILL